MKTHKSCLSSNNIINIDFIKIIALVSMIIDHIGYLFFPNHIIYRVIGRFSFILYSFCISEGIKHTSNKKKYITRLIILAFVSEIPFDLFSSDEIVNIGYQNVIFTYVFALLGILAREKYKESYGNLILAIPIIISLFFNTDYNLFGVLVIYCFFYFSNSLKGCLVSAVIIIIHNFFLLNLFGFLLSIIVVTISILIIKLYNGQKGFISKPIMTIINLFYPINLILLYLL